MGLAVKCSEVINMYIKDKRIRHGFGIIITFCLAQEARERSNKLVLREEKHILFLSGLFINPVNTEYAVDDKSEMLANILVFIIKFPLFIMTKLPMRNG